MTQCPFCNIPSERLLCENEHVQGLLDAFPVSEGHALIVPKRHVASFFHLTDDERKSLIALIPDLRRILRAEYSPDGYNIGINEGTAAGQTIYHLHLHVIPRRTGDVPDPRGGIRLLFPEKAKYWKD